MLLHATKNHSMFNVWCREHLMYVPDNILVMCWYFWKRCEFVSAT